MVADGKNICLCPKCGEEKWCYAAREPHEPEPLCLICSKGTSPAQAIEMVKSGKWSRQRAAEAVGISEYEFAVDHMGDGEWF